MDAFIAILKDFGPFLVPVAIAETYALVWMNRQMARVRQERDDAVADATGLREKRATDLERAAREYAEQGEAMRNVMREWTEKAKAVLEARSLT